MTDAIERTGKKLFRLPLPHAHGPQANTGAPAPQLPSSAPAPSEIAASVDRLNRAFEEFKAANDTRLAEIAKNKGADVVTSEKVERINGAVAELDSTVKAIGDQLKLAAVLGSNAAAAGQSPEARKYGETFVSWMRGRAGEIELKAAASAPGAFQAALSTQSDPDGGFLLPAPSVGAMTRVLEVVSAMRGLAEVMTISTPEHKKLHNLGGAGSGWVTETQGRSQTNTPTLSELKFPTFEVYAMPAATQATLDDAAVNAEAWLGGEIAIAFAEKEGAAWITGNGVNAPQGFQTPAKVANGSFAWGKLGYIASGVAAALNDGTNNGVDALTDLQHSLKAGYRPGAVFVLNDATVGKVRKLKDIDGQYLWQPTITAGVPSTLLGESSIVDDNMPDIAAGAFPIAYGNFKRGYLIVDRIGVRVLRDPFTAKPYVLFYTTKRVGGGVQDFAAIKLLKIATS